MSKEYETEKIGGRELRMPKSFPCTFKEFLRRVVGGTIASARTETDGMKFYRQFLADTGHFGDFMRCRNPVSRGDYEFRREKLKELKLDETAQIEDKDFARFPKWSEEQVAAVIEHKRRRCFDQYQFMSAARSFVHWAQDLLRRRARKGGLALKAKRDAEKAEAENQSKQAQAKRRKKPLGNKRKPRK